MPVRGQDFELPEGRLQSSIFKSEIITDLLKVMGCGVEVQGVKRAKDLAAFDLDKPALE